MEAKMANRAESLAAIAILAAGWPRVRIPKSTLEAYCYDCEELDPDALKEAALNLRRTVKWFPTISELREATRRIEEDRARFKRPVQAELPIVSPEDLMPPDPDTQAKNKRMVEELLGKCAQPFPKQPRGSTEGHE
jgi:hypothetical protein